MLNELFCEESGVCDTYRNGWFVVVGGFQQSYRVFSFYDDFFQRVVVDAGCNTAATAIFVERC